jgi:hypothetical protein
MCRFTAPVLFFVIGWTSPSEGRAATASGVVADARDDPPRLEVT